MYKAKESGKDRFEIYRQEMHAAVLARIEQERDLQRRHPRRRPPHALSADLRPRHAPHHRLRGARAVGAPDRRSGRPAACSYRWPRSSGSLTRSTPSSCARPACRRASGSGGPLGPESGHEREPVTRADSSTPTWPNGSPRQLEECEFDPRSLVLEITESAVLADNETTVRNLAELRSIGVRIALDDFGTGYSSLSHLDRLQVDIVKIDKSFVQTLGSGDDSHSLAAAMVQLAHTLGYETIGEGVENPVQERRAPGAGLPVRPGLPPRSAAQHRMYRPPAQGPGHARPGRRNPVQGLSWRIGRIAVLRERPGKPRSTALDELRLRGSSGWRRLGELGWPDRRDPPRGSRPW